MFVNHKGFATFAPREIAYKHPMAVCVCAFWKAWHNPSIAKIVHTFLHARFDSLQKRTKELARCDRLKEKDAFRAKFKSVPDALCIVKSC